MRGWDFVVWQPFGVARPVEAFNDGPQRGECNRRATPANGWAIWLFPLGIARTDAIRLT